MNEDAATIFASLAAIGIIFLVIRVAIDRVEGRDQRLNMGLDAQAIGEGDFWRRANCGIA
ncbi:hypothetical protein [uncultured Sphingomonas sp.]|uniref:hypothetical protein n=1 Tax=uncultured Sphingomonas sp. TaxID=158754 RepID=UPI00374A155E